jgi:hypothetical protein
VALPSGIRTKVKSIVTYDGKLEEASAGSAITVTLQDEVDLSRGDLLVGAASNPFVGQAFDAKLVWMHPEPLDSQKLYLLKHTTRTVRARVKLVRHRVDVNTLAQHSATTLNMNDLGLVEINTTLPLAFDAFQRIAAMGSFILIDPISNATVAAGMIAGPSQQEGGPVLVRSRGAVTAHERSERFGHGAAAIWVEAGNDVAESIERELFDQGSNVHVVRTDGFNDIELKAIARAFRTAGVVGIFSAVEENAGAKTVVRESFGEARFFHLSDGTDEAITTQVQNKIQEWKHKPSSERGQS